MADSQTNININIDTSQALANLKALQSQISAFQTSMTRGSATQAANAAKLRQNLVNDINATKKFSASIQNIQTTTESFTEALEKNKMSMGQYFKYAGASTKTFGKLFKSEFNTIEKVARERVKTLQTQYIQLGRDASGAMKAIAVRPLTLDMENLGTKTAIAAQKQQILNQLLKQGSTNMLNWGKNTQWAGRQLMVGFTIPLSMAGTAAAKAFMEMEEAVIKFKRVYGELETTGAETDRMAKDLQKLASEYTKYGVAVSKTMDMAASAAATGKTGSDLLAQVAQATKLAVLGGVEQAQALETTISLTNAFGTAAKDLAGDIDFLNAVENQTVTSIEDLTVAIPKAAPVIKQLGGDVKDLAFFLTAMKEGGINASEGANALKSGIASMINPTAKASEFLAGFGINLKGIVESNAGNVKGMVVGFAQALNQLDPLNRARAIEQLFGKFQFARISTLFKNVTEGGSQANKVLELTSRTSQELAILSERELKKVESSPMFKFKKTIEDLKKELIPIGEAFLKAITPIVKFAGELLANFNKMGTGAKNFWIGVTTVVAGVGPVLLMTVGLIANGVANLIKMFTGIKSIFNRTSEDTTVLGEATDYMTQKQLEASAVAASLEQVHQTLEQRFTSEAGAVNLLTDAYQRNVAAQAQYSPSSVVPSDVAGSYATGGIIRGPGSGTSDSILARVSNGEAVIPAKAVARNPELVSALISGNIPAFSQGVIVNGISMSQDYADEPGIPSRRKRSISGNTALIADAGYAEEAQVAIDTLLEFGATATQARKLISHLNQAVEKGPEVVATWMKALQENTKTVKTGTELEQAMKDSTGVAKGTSTTNFTHIGDGATYIDKNGKEQVVKSYLGMDDFDATVNRKLTKRGGGASPEQFIEAFNVAGVEKWSTSIKRGGGNVEELASDVEILDTKIKNFIQSSGATKVFDLKTDADAYGEGATSVQEAFAQARLEMPDSKLIGSLDASAATPRDLRVGGAMATIPKGFDRKTASKKLGEAYQEEMAVADAKAYAEKRNEELAKEENDPVHASRSKQRNSPHPQSAVDGKDDANAYADAKQEQLKAREAQNPSAFVKNAKAGIDNAFDISTPAPIVDPNAAQKLTKKSLNIVSEAIAEQGDILAGVKGKVIVLNDGLKQMSTSATDAANAAQDAANATDTSTDSTSTNTEATEENTGATDKNTDSKKENTENQRSPEDEARFKKQRTKAQFQRTFGTVAKIGAAATTIVGMASMVPGKIGEVAQAVTPSIGAFTTLTGMVNGPVTGALAALIAVVGGIIMAITNLDKAYKETQEKVISLKKVVGTSSESIRALSEFAGRVSAGESMDRVRKDKAKLVYAAPGKTTFGESFVQSDQGKALLTGLKEDMARKGGSTSSTVASITGQLSTAVMSGALSEAEAFSIASNIGAELGNMDITLQVRAQLSEILGPNGEKVSGGGILNVAAGLQERNIATMSESMQVLSDNMENNRLWSGGENTAVNRNVTAGGTVLASAGTGAAIGAGIGAAVSLVTGGLIAPVTVAIGAVIGTIAGAIVGFNVAMGTLEEQTKAVAELGAVVAADMTATLSTQKEMADSLDAYYLKKIDEARIEGDITEAKRLQLEYDDKRNQLAAVGLQAREAIMQLYSTTDAAELEAINAGLENAMNVRYKDDALQQVYIPVVQNQLETAVKNEVATEPQVALIKAELAAGTMSPQDASNLLKIMATDKDAGKKLFSIETKFGATTMGEVAQVASMFSGDNAKEQRAQFVMDVEAAATSSEAQDIIDFTREIAKYAGVMKSSILVDVIQKNPAATKRLQGIFDQLENNKGKMTTDVVYNIIPSLKGSEAFDENYFNSLKDSNEKITYVKTVSAIMEMTEPELKQSPDFIRWQGDEAKKAGLGTYPGNHSISWWQKRYAEDMGVKVTNAMKSDLTTAPGTETPTGGGSGPEPSWLDAIVTRVRNLYDSAQKLTVGYKASGDALSAFAKSGKSALGGMTGMADKLYNANLSQDIIDGILGMPKEEAEKWMKMFFDKKGKITQFVKELNATIGGLNYEQFLQENTAINNTLKNQQTATVALTQFTDNLNVARSILNDENATAVLAGAMLSGSLEDQRKKTQRLTKAYLDNMAAQRLGKDKRQVSVDDANLSINTLQKENEIYQNGVDIISKKSEKVAETYDKQIEALNKVKSINEEISRQKQGELDIAEALSKGDIGAAAKAIQQLRAQQAQDASERQIKALEDAKKRAVDSLTVEINGQLFTRSELEGKIYDIELDVLQIKKDQILQNELSLAQSEEELNNIVKQIAKLKELKAVKNLPDNKPATGGGTTGGGTSSGTSNGTKDTAKDDKPDPNAKDQSTQNTGTTGAGASAFDASNALKGQTAANLASRFGGEDRLSATLSGLSMSQTISKQLAGSNAASEKLREAKKLGYATINPKTGLYEFRNRSEVAVKDRADYDKKKKEFDDLILANKAIQATDDAARQSFISSLSPEIQNAFNVLKNRIAERAKLASKEKTAKEVYNDTISRNLGFENGRPKIGKDADGKDLAADKAIADTAWKTYMDSGGRELSLFDSRIAQLERSLETAGFSKKRVTDLIGKYATGGYVSGGGTATSDSIPAMLSDGEFVVKASTVDKIGVGALNHMNQTGSVAKLAKGGSVMPKKAGSSKDDLGPVSGTESAEIQAQRKAQWKKLSKNAKPTAWWDPFNLFGTSSSQIEAQYAQNRWLLSQGYKYVGDYNASTKSRQYRWIDKDGYVINPSTGKKENDFLTGKPYKFETTETVFDLKKGFYEVPKKNEVDKNGKYLGFADGGLVTSDYMGTSQMSYTDPTINELFTNKSIRSRLASWIGSIGNRLTGNADWGQEGRNLGLTNKQINAYLSSGYAKKLNARQYAKLGGNGKNNAAVQLGLIQNDKSLTMEAARIASSFVPGIGSGVGLAGTVSGLAQGDFKSAGVSALGAFGGFGGALKLGSKGLNAIPGFARTTQAASRADSAFSKFNNKFGTYANVAGTSQGYLESWLTQNKMLPKFHKGGLVPGSYDMPLMAKGGEFVMSDYAVKQYGTGTMNAMNSGNAAALGDSVYNYSVNVNVANTGANPNDIARTVISQIKQIDAQRIRSNNI